MNSNHGATVLGISWVFAVILGTTTALGQTATPAGTAQGAATVSPPATPQPAAPPPAAPAPAALPMAVVPPGYALVPIGPAPTGDGASTRYDVQYPQARGALPPGMELPYSPGDPIPPGYHVVEQQRRGLIIAGSLTAGVPWALGVAVAAGANFEEKTGWLAVPVLGPWLMIAAGGAKDEQTCDATDTYCEDYDDGAAKRSILALDGLVQTAGAVMFVCGVTIPRKRLIRQDVTVSMIPTRVGREGYGMGLVGSF
jgi:hypothetical protein